MAQLLGQKYDSNAGALYAHLLFVVSLVLLPRGLAGERR
jgi:branched-chain amino acid transport system permease protein